MADTHLMSLAEIFNQKLFRIPDFQRGFSWEYRQLSDFWDDIQNLKEGRIHYTGMLTVEQVKLEVVKKIDTWQDDIWLLESDHTGYYIIDGQQRLTTVIILLNEIIKAVDVDDDLNYKKTDHWINKYLFQKWDKAYKSYLFGYEKDNPSDQFFKTKVLEQESLSADKVPEMTLYTKNLLFAKEYFAEKVKDLLHDELQNLFRKVTNSLRFNFYEIDDELDVYVTFETMNNRGKALSNLELLKNRLIYLSTVLDVSSQVRQKFRSDINETWKTIYEYLGKDSVVKLDDDDFLRDHWIMYFKYERSIASAFANFLLNKHFTVKNVIEGRLGIEDLQEYISSLSKSVKAWFYLHHPEHSKYREDVIEWINKLNRLGISAFPPLLMAVFQKENEDNTFKLLQVVERFIFLIFRVTQRPSNTKNNEFYRLAHTYYHQKDNVTIESVIKNIEIMTQGEEGEGDDYKYLGWFNWEKFVQNMDELFKRDNGFYKWNGIRYFLYEYELDLQKKAGGDNKISWSEFISRRREESIEHIYPQTPTDKEWVQAFRGTKKLEKKILTNSLGNLLLLSRVKNSELQNKPFSKKKHYTNSLGDEVGYFNGSYSEIQVAQNDSWTPQEILEHGKMMIDFLGRRWGIDFEGWEDDKYAPLGLSFISEE